MSILRVVCGPADIGAGGYIWETANESRFDPTRVDGAFGWGDNYAIDVPHDAPSGQETWYHFRYAQESNDNVFMDENVITFQDSNGLDVAHLNMDDNRVGIAAVGDTTEYAGTTMLAANVPYSFDIHITVAATITARFYINGALYGEKTAQNTGGKGPARSMIGAFGYHAVKLYMSEIIIADEDTRGMRVRELRPQSFGIYQEWDGLISSLRDTDLATGISTDTANRRVSFGVSNIENIKPGDVINRVVAQTYAQKGETGLSGFNHFFRHKNGNVSDGAAQTLDVLGGYFLEEFATNPDTGAAWQPEDFSSLQTGVQSLT